MKKSYFAAQPDGNKDLVGSQTDINFHTIMFVMFVMLTKKKRRIPQIAEWRENKAKNGKDSAKKFQYTYFFVAGSIKNLFLNIQFSYVYEQFLRGKVCGWGLKRWI